MRNKKFIKIANDVINLEIKALQKLKKTITPAFSNAVIKIAKCQSKVVLCGVGKSGLIASKISATLASVGTPSFNLAAGEASHGDLGMISKNDILILISNSGQTNELKNIIKFANRNKIFLIGIVSKKNSILYKNSNINLLLPKVTEAEGIIPTSSTTAQLALGDALAIASMNYKKFGRLDFKKLHPAGSLGAQLRTVEDIMITGNKIPFVEEKLGFKKALNILTKKKLGFLLVQNKKKDTLGIITDGQIRRFSETNHNLFKLSLKNIMTKNPMSINKDSLAEKALSLMNEKKITALCVHRGDNIKKTVGILHIHTILQSNIN